MRRLRTFIICLVVLLLLPGFVHAKSMILGGWHLVATYTTAAYISADGTNDFLWLPTQTLAAYPGVEGTRAEYMAIVTDPAGKRAITYLGEPGTETLGDEVIAVADDRTMASDTGWWSKGSGWTINDAVAGKANHAGGTYTKLSRDDFLTTGALHCLEVTITGPMDFRHGDTTRAIEGNISFTADGTNIKFATGADGSTIDDVSIKIYTDGPPESLHCFSDITCDTRGWLSIDAGFNYNAASYDIQIMKLR